MPEAEGSRRRDSRPFVQPGAAPGTLVADPDAPAPLFHVIAYGPESLEEADLADPDQIRPFLDRQRVTWLNVDGLGDITVISRLGEIFGLHRLALEDIVNVNQRAKVEDYENGLYMVARMVEFSTDMITTEQLSMFLGEKFLLTFQERRGDSFNPVRQRIRTGRGRIRKAGPGYLAYAILDAVVDYYFPVLEAYGERLEALEAEVLDRPTRRTMEAIHAVRRDLLEIRRSVWPLRDAVHRLQREAASWMEEEDRYYLQDCYDHTVRVIEMLEAYREMGSSLMDAYLSSISNRMNEVMKVLTMFAAIFIPLSFIAGLYGMNFNTSRSEWNMPELNWAAGYPFALALMALVASVLLFYFYRKGWIGQDRENARRRRRFRVRPFRFLRRL
ncbi:MAG: magnesium/cobalt transporter CorA [Gemmatimonadales bacterium]